MTTTYNTAPYFDDFDDSKNFYQIMFRPGTAVQARELTQLQTILRSQIEKFGDHIFRHGSVVIPGNSFADLATPYVKLQSTFGDVSIISNNFEGKVIVGLSTGIRAFVQKAVAANETDPVTLYLSYLKGSSEGDITFRDDEEIYVEDSTSVRALTLSSSSTGVGSLAFINQGVYYINGSFVFVEKQSTVIDKYSSNPSCNVLLEIKENIVTADDDDSLLDPAQGSYNYAAPGADRVQISLDLVSLPLGTALTQNYVEIMRYNNGVLEEHAKTPKYSELEKSLARRTFDESGNYVVSGLKPKIREHLKESSNGGVYSDGDADLLVAEIEPGKAYINGFEVEKISKTRINIPKARTSNHIKNTDVVVRPEYGQYIIVSDIVGSLDIRDRQVIDLYNDNDPAESSATKIGTARVLGIDYLIDDPATGAIYKLLISDLILESSYSIESVGGIRYGSGKYAYVLVDYTAPSNGGNFTVGEIINNVSGRTATVRYWDGNTGRLFAYKHDHTKETPRVGDLITGATSDATSTISSKKIIESDGQTELIFRLPKSVLFSLIDPDTNSYNLSYTVQKELSITTDASGNGSVSVVSGEEINAIEVGTFVAIGPNGIVQNNLFSLNSSGTTLTLTGGPASAIVKAYASVEKRNVSPKTKTVETNTEVISSPSNTITLEKTDIISITSVIDSTGDITANYTFSNGQTAYAYNRGTLTLKPGASSPSGSVTITYSYYQHSVSGDFFTIDSYPEGILDNNVVFVSNSSGERYNLAACLDFRPSVGENGEFTGTGSKRNDLIISETTFNSSLQFYVPRIDTLVVNSAGKISTISGIPSEEPRAPNVPKNQFPLNIFYIPAYTKSYIDVVTERLSVERYTMRDIHNVTKRIDRVEEFATLTAEEQVTIDYEIVDAATGLNRFKSGYIAESFNNPLIIARPTAPGFRSTFVKNNLEAGIEDTICPMVLLSENSSNYTINGNRIMLPYAEDVFAEQNLSSRVTNVNPFLVIRWNGVLDVNPSSDDWVETRQLPTIFEEETETVIIENYVPCPPPEPTVRQIFAITNATISSSASNPFSISRFTSRFVVFSVPAEYEYSINGANTIYKAGGGGVLIISITQIGISSQINFTDLATGESQTAQITVELVPEDSLSSIGETSIGTQVNQTNSGTDTPVVNEVVNVRYGGLYGAILGRPGEEEGLSWWTEQSQTLEDDELINEFIRLASENYQSGTESTLNDEGIKAALNGELDSELFGDQVIISSVIKKMPDGKLLESGILADGSKFTTTVNK